MAKRTLTTKPAPVKTAASPTFRALPQYPRAHYETAVWWRDLDRYVLEQQTQETSPLVLEPDYQRGHVWTDAQRSAYVEYGLMGGESSMAITSNCPGWMGDWRGPWELVDGLQRVTAVLKTTLSPRGLAVSG